jgi:branched-subunit amino acid transport protein
VPLLAISDVVWQAIIAAVVTLILAYFGRSAQVAASRAADKTRQVKDALAQRQGIDDARLDEMAAVGIATHKLVNNAMAVQLELNAQLSHRVAKLTHDPADIEAALVAAKLLQEHMAKQAAVDKLPTPKTPKKDTKEEPKP